MLHVLCFLLPWMFVSLHVLTACLSPPARTRTNDCFPTACFFLLVFFSFLSTSTDFRAPFSYHFFLITPAPPTVHPGLLFSYNIQYRTTQTHNSIQSINSCNSSIWFFFGGKGLTVFTFNFGNCFFLSSFYLPCGYGFCSLVVEWSLARRFFSPLYS